MTDLHSPMILHHHSPIHVVVPLRPGADLDLVRAKLSGAFAQHDHPVVWHIPRERVTSFNWRITQQRLPAINAGLLVAAGGDGTINAVAAAALRAGVPMGVVPMGTFNHFSREQGLELDAETAVLQLLEALRAGELRPVQVGFVNDRVFFWSTPAWGCTPVAGRARAGHAQAGPLSRGGHNRCGVEHAAPFSARRRWRVVVRTRQGTEMQEQEHEVTTLFVGNNPLQLEQVGLAQAESVAQGGRWPCVAQTPKPLGHGSHGMARRYRPAGGRPGRAKPGLCRAECGARWVAQGQREGGFDGERNA